MPTLPIPFTSYDPGIDKLGGTASLPQNQQDGFWLPTVTPEGKKFMWVKRPGLTEMVKMTTPASASRKIMGLFIGPTGSNIGGVALRDDGKIYQFTPISAASTSDITGTSTPGATYSPSFVNYSNTKFFVCGNGANIAVTTYSTSWSGAVNITDAQCPTLVRAIGYLNKVLFAQSSVLYSRRVDYSDSGSPESWAGLYDTIDFLTSEAVYMVIENGYIYYFNTDYIEIWRDSGDTFVRVEIIIPLGIEYAHNCCSHNGVIYFLAKDHNLYSMAGTQVQRLTTNDNAVTAAIAYQIYTASSTNRFPKLFPLTYLGQNFICLCYFNKPAWVYHIELNQWYQWGTWNSGTSSYDKFMGLCSAFHTNSGYMWVGSHVNDKVFRFTGTTDDGTTIRTVLQTDIIDRGDASREKICHELIFTFKGAYIASGTAKNLTFNYRDEGSTTWSGDFTVPMEKINTTDFSVSVYRLGNYKTRQWRFINDQVSDAGLIDVKERFEFGK